MRAAQSKMYQRSTPHGLQGAVRRATHLIQERSTETNPLVGEREGGKGREVGEGEREGKREREGQLCHEE